MRGPIYTVGTRHRQMGARVRSFSALLAPDTPTGLAMTPSTLYGSLATITTSTVPTGQTWSVDRSTNGVSWTSIGSILAGSSSLAVTGLTPETAYYVRARAYAASTGLYSGYAYLGGGASPGSTVTTIWDPSADASAFSWDTIAGARAAGRLWQNAAKTSQATTNGQLVRVWTDSKGNDWSASSDAARWSLYDEGGGKWSLLSDGVGSLFQCTTLGAFTGRYLLMRLIHESGVGVWASWNGLADYYPFVDNRIYCGFGSTVRRDGIIPASSLSAGYSTLEVLASSTWQMFQNGTSIASFASNTTTAMSAMISIGGIVGFGYSRKRLTGLAISSAVPDSSTQAKYRAWAGAL